MRDRSLRKSSLTKKLGELTRYTRCVSESDRDKRTLKISQTTCIEQLVDRFDIISTVPFLVVHPLNSGRGRKGRGRAHNGT